MDKAPFVPHPPGPQEGKARLHPALAAGRADPAPLPDLPAARLHLMADVGNRRRAYQPRRRFPLACSLTDP